MKVNKGKRRLKKRSASPAPAPRKAAQDPGGSQRQQKAAVQKNRKPDVQAAAAPKAAPARHKKHAEKKEKQSFRERWFPKREKGDPVILICCLILLGLGILMAGSLSNYKAFESYREAMSDFIKQILFAVTFLGACYLVDRFFSFKLMKYAAIPLILVYFALMILVALKGDENYGAKSWIYIGGVSVQPSEFFKPLIIALCALMVYTYTKKKKCLEPTAKNFWRVTWLPALCLAGTIGLLIAQKDIGTLTICALISVVCFLIPSMPCLSKYQKWVKILMSVGVAASLVLFVFTDWGTRALASSDRFSHIAVRINNFKDPYTDLMGQGFQTGNGLYAIGDGGLTGKGFGNSERKYGFLTQAESDFILSIIVEELGLFGLLTVTVCYLLLGWRLFGFAIRARDQGDKVILSGVAAYLLLHFFINVGGVGGLIPLTGVPLLLLSKGGTSMLATGIAVGLAQSSIRHVKADLKEHRRQEKARKLAEEQAEEKDQASPADALYQPPLAKGAV